MKSLSRVLLPSLFWAGCLYTPQAFVTPFVEEQCAYALECYTDDILEFRGWTSEEDCLAEVTPEVSSDATECKFDRDKAKSCMAQLKAEGCPSSTLPSDCDSIYVFCDGVPEDTGDDSDTDES